jgi:hypothetical protein
MPLEEVFQHLRCTKDGLTSEDAQERLTLFGHNKLEEKKVCYVQHSKIDKVLTFYSEHSTINYLQRCVRSDQMHANRAQETRTL